jgi:hypothetical protein
VSDPAQDPVRRQHDDRRDMSTMDRASWEKFTMDNAHLPADHVAKLSILADALLDGVVTRTEVDGMPVEAWMALISSRRVA